jgi:hypothetical protein
MADCSSCGITLHCGSGCSIFCSADCTLCTVHCAHQAMISVNRKTGDMQIGVGTPGELPELEMPSYSDQEHLRVSFNDVPRGSLAHSLGNHLRRTVRVAAGNEDERISGSDEGTVAELAAKYSLIVE